MTQILLEPIHSHEWQLHFTGVNVSTLPQFSSSLISASSYIAEVNITDDSLRGEWTVSFQSGGSYTLQIYGNSELSFTADLFRMDSSNAYGFSKIEGKPSQG